MPDINPFNSDLTVFFRPPSGQTEILLRAADDFLFVSTSRLSIVIQTCLDLQVVNRHSNCAGCHSFQTWRLSHSCAISQPSNVLQMSQSAGCNQKLSHSCKMLHPSERGSGSSRGRPLLQLFLSMVPGTYLS